MSADPLLVETVERLLANLCTRDEVERAEADGGWSRPVWDALAGAGFDRVGIDESQGGAGGSIQDTAAILRAVGRFAAPVPIAETAMLGGWLLAEVGLPLPDGPVAIVPELTAHLRDDGALALTAPTAWARHAARIVFVHTTGTGLQPLSAHGRVVSVRPDQVEISPGANLAGEARDRVTVVAPPDDWETAPADGLASTLRFRGCLSRIVLAAGALDTVARMTIDYTNQRHQFGRPIASFQAVQQHLVTVAQCSVRAQMAADIVVRAWERGGGTTETAAARVVVDDAITIGTRAAHQAHGAMGVTREYPLHQLTRRLWSWRHEWGTARRWRRELGSTVVMRGADELFDLVTEHPVPRP